MATLSSAETTRPMMRPRMKGMRVSSGSSLRRYIAPSSQAGSAVGRRRRYHSEVIQRTSRVAVRSFSL